MKVTGILISGIISFALVCSSFAQAGEADDYFKQARELIDKGDYQQAIDYVKKAVELKPDSPLFYTALGLCYHNIGRDEAAIPELESAMRLKGGYSPSYLLGLIYWQKNKFQDAVRYLNSAVAYWTPRIRNTDSFNLLGFSYMQIDNLKEAKKVLERAYEINGSSSVTLYLLASCNDMMGNGRGAASYYQRYLKSNHNNPQMIENAEQRLADIKQR